MRIKPQIQGVSEIRLESWSNQIEGLKEYYQIIQVSELQNQMLILYKFIYFRIMLIKNMNFCSDECVSDLMIACCRACFPDDFHMSYV